MATCDFQHFLITRFNIVMPWKNYFRPDGQWCERRVSLFNTFCLPAVKQQTTQNFTWLVLFDSESTPQWLRDKAEEYSRAFPPFTPVYMDVFTPDKLRNEISRRLVDNVSRIVTTRLDTDDVVRSGFIDTIQKMVKEDPDFIGFLNFDNGYFHEADKSYLWHESYNAFCSCVQDNKLEFLTCHHVNHHKMFEHGEVKHIEDEYWYAFVNHDNNISGRTASKEQYVRVPNRRLATEFQIPEFAVKESFFGRCAENGYVIMRKLCGRARRLFKRAVQGT